MTYKDDPKVKVFYPKEEILKENEGDDGTQDSWFGLLEYDGKYAVDYNYYVDGYDGEVENYSRFYGCFPNGKGDIVIDPDFYSECCYIIDFDDPEWKEKLLQEAYEFLINEVLKGGEIYE